MARAKRGAPLGADHVLPPVLTHPLPQPTNATLSNANRTKKSSTGQASIQVQRSNHALQTERTSISRADVPRQ